MGANKTFNIPHLLFQVWRRIAQFFYVPGVRLAPDQYSSQVMHPMVLMTQSMISAPIMMKYVVKHVNYYTIRNILYGFDILFNTFIISFSFFVERDSYNKNATIQQIKDKVIKIEGNDDKCLGIIFDDAVFYLSSLIDITFLCVRATSDIKHKTTSFEILDYSLWLRVFLTYIRGKMLHIFLTKKGHEHYGQYIN